MFRRAQYYSITSPAGCCLHCPTTIEFWKIMNANDPFIIQFSRNVHVCPTARLTVFLFSCVFFMGDMDAKHKYQFDSVGLCARATNAHSMWNLCVVHSELKKNRLNQSISIRPLIGLLSELPWFGQPRHVRWLELEMIGAWHWAKKNHFAPFSERKTKKMQINAWSNWKRIERQLR